MSAAAARRWLAIILVADTLLAVLAWVFVIGFMRAPFWTPEPQHHAWADYRRATVVVLGGGLATVAVVTVVGRWLVGRGLRVPGVLVAALPLEALLGMVVIDTPL